jgi:hypothetical protein
MFLRFNRRFKDGKEDRYWNIVESNASGKVVQRQVLYLGEINNTQRELGVALSKRLTKTPPPPATCLVPGRSRGSGASQSARRAGAARGHRIASTAAMGCVLVGVRLFLLLFF